MNSNHYESVIIDAMLLFIPFWSFWMQITVFFNYPKSYSAKPELEI
uniref:Uncharacterized protein n=1 Tax=Arundo donax TaxID=35708 RepID=A0A0A9ESJ1_ARUDO